jgi:hypothetical protein
MEKFKVYVRGEKITPDQFKDLKMYNACYHKYAEISTEGVMEKFNLPIQEKGKITNVPLFFSSKVEESSALVIIEPFLEGTREEISFEMGIARAKNIPIIILTDTDKYQLPNLHLYRSWLGVLNRLNQMKFQCLSLKEKTVSTPVYIEGRYGC